MGDVNKQSKQSSLTLLLGLSRYLSGRRRWQLAGLVLVMLASGTAELVTLGAVLPFLAVLSEPEHLWQQPLIQVLAAWAGFTRPSQLLLPAMAVFAGAAVITALIRLTNLWLIWRLSAVIGSDLSCEAYQRTLYQPYAVHLQRNSSEVINAVTIQIRRSVSAFKSFLQVITGALVALGLLAGLLMIDWAVALATAALLASAYGLLVFISRQEVSRNSQAIALASAQLLKALQEGLGAIRDVLLDGSQATYLAIYRQADRPQRLLTARNGFLRSFPRFALEALGLLAIVLLGGVLVVQKGSGGAVIPLLGALALGAQRLLPALQQIYSHWMNIKGFSADLAGVLAMMKQPLPPLSSHTEPLVFQRCIRFEAVHFRYGSERPEVLRGLDVQIGRGERIGIIGTTGSGKSTMVDLLMGLLSPTLGSILVDGKDLHDPNDPERLAAWRMAIAHVPQTIYLADISIAENIAFGLPKALINLKRVQDAAEKAQIAGFIESSPEGYSACLGERGIRLSGGQRQRIGIARALYKQASVLVFDEATSALDHACEQALMETIDGLSPELTVVMIAHRLSTLSRCNRVIKVDQGALVADGPPELVLKAR